MSLVKNYLIVLEGVGTYWFDVVIIIMCKIILSNKNVFRGEFSRLGMIKFI